MAMVNTRDSTQGMVKIWEIKATAIRHSKQLARHSWDVVNPGLNKPEKEAVVFFFIFFFISVVLYYVQYCACSL